MWRVLILHSRGELVQGGTVSFLRNLLSHLDRNLVEPHLVFLSPGELPRQFEALSASVQVLDVPHVRQVGRTAATIYRLSRFIKEQNIHLIFSNDGRAHVFGGLAAQVTHRQAWWYCHNVLGDPISWLDRLTAIIPAEQVLTNSAFTENSIQQRFPRLKTRVLYLGIRVPTEPLPSAETRRKLGIPERCPVIGSFGLLTPLKGQEVLLKALPHIRARLPEVRTFIVGDVPRESDRPYRQKLHELVSSLNLDGHVIFTGFRSDTLDLMATCDLIVHTSVAPDAFGLVLLEGMAMERPVVASALGGAPEAIVEGETGLLVPPGDPEALAQACLTLLQNPERCQEMGRKGREHVARNFSADRMAREFEGLLMQRVSHGKATEHLQINGLS